MIRRIISCLLLILLSINGLQHVKAIEMTDNVVVVENSEKHIQVSALLEQRYELCKDYENNEELILDIDARLEQLGVERLSSMDLAEKIGVDASPMVTPKYQQYVDILSERVITVWNGKRYEVQIITCMPNHKDSPLRPSANFEIDTESNKQAQAIQFATAVGEGAISLASGGVADAISHVFTAYNVLSAYSNLVTPTTVVSGVDNAIGKISLSIIEKYFFIKNEGSPDTGYQIEACVTNKIEYEAKVLYEGDILVDGVSVASVDCLSFGSTIYGQYYDENGFDGKGITRSAQVFWEYKTYGTSSFQVVFIVDKIRLYFAGGHNVIIRTDLNGIAYT